MFSGFAAVVYGVLLSAASVCAAYNAASVWGIESNKSYFPTMANILFQTSLSALDTAHRDLGTQGLFQISWTQANNRSAVWSPDGKSYYCPSPIPRFHNTTRCVTMRADIDQYWRGVSETLKPWRENGTVTGIFLGDEVLYHGVSMQNLTYITKLIRADWPEAILCVNWPRRLLSYTAASCSREPSTPGVPYQPASIAGCRYINEAQDALMCNFNRMNETLFHEGDCWPEELDWMGFDIYGFDLATRRVHIPRTAATAPSCCMLQ